MTEHSDGVPSVLVVEDDRDLLSVLQRILSGEGFNVRSAQDGEAGLLEALDHAPDLVILDIGLPRKNGVEVARELRSRGFRAPMLMLTARTSVSDKVSGLDAGADDYLPKPFEFAELLARVKALLRRSSLTAESAVMRVRDLSLDPISRRVERGGKEIELTQKEYALLEYLMRNMGRTVSRQMISEHVWRQQVDPLTNVVDVYINYLRKKLEEDRDHPLIHTVRGSGYVLRDDAAPAVRTEATPPLMND
ncbi:MAG TPA: response regulator transcription factor [Gemmatimonadaceae bacterium]|nr:response regulator transcription factor [Gemmatimonadaceae bacterium]